ncbi:unnamed protein product [Ophioblennius macclurei]
MDAESGDVFPDVMATGSWKLHPPLSGAEPPLQDWAVEPERGEDPRTLSDSDSEAVLQAVNPNEVFSGGVAADTSSESDSGISEEPPVSVATAPLATPTVYQVVYDISGVGGAAVAPGQENVISIELDEWSSQLLLSDSCIVNELPLVSAVRPTAAAVAATTATFTGASDLDDDLLYADLQLTEEEQKLLSQEGVSLPNNLPLTKAEERILKKVRRKIRNKQSAQDSRRRRKEYIDGLESRAAACSAQNRELQRTVEKLEKHNMSLLAQLQQLQSLIRKTVSKGAQTSTCLLIILVSLGLIILPSISPFSHRSPTDDDYRPTGVISRNILTDPSSQQAADDVDPPTIRSDAPSPPSEPGGGVSLQEPIENLQNSTFDGTAREDGQSGNSSAAPAAATSQDGSASTAGDADAAKPAHADEM